MTHQELQRQLIKYNLKLIVQPWIDHKFNINPTQTKLSISKSDRSMGITNLNPFDFKNRNDEYVYIVETQSNQHYIIAQISTDESNIWQRDHNYQPHNKDLWNLVKKFVKTPVIKRDLNDYVLFLGKHIYAGCTQCNALALMADDQNQPLLTTDTEDQVCDFLYFDDHFSKSFLQKYIKKHHDPKAKIIPVRDIYKSKCKQNRAIKKWNQTHKETDYFGGSSLLVKRSFDYDHKSFMRVNFKRLAKVYKGTTKHNGQLTKHQKSGWDALLDPFNWLFDMSHHRIFYATSLGSIMGIPTKYQGCNKDYQILSPIYDAIKAHEGWTRLNRRQAITMCHLYERYDQMIGAYDQSVDQAQFNDYIINMHLGDWLHKN